jgi:hypothetical protein
MMKMCAALWGSQSWLQPAFSRPSAGHEGSLMAQEPPERRLRARLPAPHLFSRKAPPCASERSSAVETVHDVRFLAVSLLKLNRLSDTDRTSCMVLERPASDAKIDLGVDVKFRHNVLYYHILPVCKELSPLRPFRR